MCRFRPVFGRSPLTHRDHQRQGLIRSDMLQAVPAIVISLFFIAGAVMLFAPQVVYRMPGGSIYTQEYLNKFATRVMTRAMGVLFMVLCIEACSSGFQKDYPEWPERSFLSFGILFGFIWVSGFVLGLVTWISPKAKAWTERFSTDKITIRQHRIEIGIGVAALLLSAGWAAVPLIAP
jgi:hypothetical protein